VQVDEGGARVRVRFVGGTAAEDEWLPRDSARLRCAAASTPSDKGSASMSPTPTLSSATPDGEGVPGWGPQATPLRRPVPSSHWRAASAQPPGAMAEESPMVCPGKPSPRRMSPFPDLNWSLDGVVPDDCAVAEEEEAEEEDDDAIPAPEDGCAALPLFVEVCKAAPGGRALGGTVEVSVLASGPDLSFQWFEGDEAIPGARSRALVLLNDGERGGPLRCLVRNAYGAAWALCPVLLPSSPEDAAAVAHDLQGPGMYRMTCRCGREREAPAAALCAEPCACGALCAGTATRLGPLVPSARAGALAGGLAAC